MSELLPLTPEKIEQNAISMTSIVGEYEDAKLKAIMAKQEWEHFFATALYEGAVDGKNDAQRMGAALAINPDLHLRMVITMNDAYLAEKDLKMARVHDKAIGRLIMMANHSVGLDDYGETV